MQKASMQPHPCDNPRGEQGFIALIAVVLVGAIGAASAVALLQLGVQQSRTSLAYQQSVEAQALADACAEYALNELRQSLTYAGSETLTLGSGTCTIEAIGGTGNTNRTIQTTSTVGTVVRKVEVEVANVRNIMSLTSWQEVADY